MIIADNLLKEFATKKAEAEYSADLNLRRALLVPEFKKCYEQIKTLQYDIAKAEYSNLSTAKERKELAKLKVKIHKIAKDNNIDTTTLKPNYFCKKCKDSGKINGNYCTCFKTKLSKKLLQQSGLKVDKLPSFDKMSLDIVKKPKQKEDYNAICDILKKYVSKLKETDKKVVLLSGEVGVGKTYLLKATVNESIKHGYFAIYTTAFDLNSVFLKYHCARLEDKDAILEKYLTCDLLLIDDLGTENKLNNVTTQYLYLILNERLENEKNTIITTNLDMGGLKNNYDERIMSRLSNKRTCIPIILKGDDLRLN